MLQLLKLQLGRNKMVKRPLNMGLPLTSFFDLCETDIKGDCFKFEQLRGKKTLIVNTASNCGFTYQYTLLENLKNLYCNKLNVLAFPCNNFRNQEPESESSILEFCTKEHQVSFPIFQKIDLSPKLLPSVYSWLSTTAKNGWNNRLPVWNFCKYIINENGVLECFAGPAILPTHKGFMDLLEA